MGRAFAILLLAWVGLDPARGAATEDETGPSLTGIGNPKLSLVNWANRNLERAANVSPEGSRHATSTTSLTIRSLSDNLRGQLRSTAPSAPFATAGLRQEEGFLRIRSSGLDDGPLTAPQRAALTSRHLDTDSQLGLNTPAAEPGVEPDLRRMPTALAVILAVGALGAIALVLRQLRD